MPSSNSVFATENAQKYLNQLIKHFAHKIEAKVTDNEGVAYFVCGTSNMKAENNVLNIDIVSEDDAGLAQTKNIIEDHLIRFAFREKLEKLEWQDA